MWIDRSIYTQKPFYHGLHAVESQVVLFGFRDLYPSSNPLFIFTFSSSTPDLSLYESKRK